jgi:hypothetical protein
VLEGGVEQRHWRRRSQRSQWQRTGGKAAAAPDGPLPAAALRLQQPVTGGDDDAATLLSTHWPTSIIAIVLVTGVKCPHIILVTSMPHR